MILPVLDPRLKKISVIITIVLIGAAVVFGIYNLLRSSTEITSPIADNLNNTENATDEQPEMDYEGTEVALSNKQTEKNALQSVKHPNTPEDTTQPFNILILGIDRRYGGQTHWRTDVIQLITLSANRNNAVVTHIPRDVWSGTYKVNAVYNLQGPEGIKDIVEEITGQRPDRIIRVDFDAFVWAVDAVGGVTVNLPIGFTDTSYPNDRKGKEETITVTFKPGKQTMDGETALIYARSRKGNNGEGSDYARGKRQQIIMRSIIHDFFKPDNLFKPKTAEVLYRLATEKIYTDLTLTDTKILFELLKNYKTITVRTLGLDTSNFLEVPKDRSAYGGAWTLIPKGGSYAPIHEEIKTLLQ